MTDKVQKIREGVKKLKSQLLRGACSSQIAMETMCKEEAYNEVLAILDSMQEEPVSEDLEEAAKEYAKAKHQNEALIDILSMDFKAGAQWQKQKEINEIRAEIKKRYEHHLGCMEGSRDDTYPEISHAHHRVIKDELFEILCFLDVLESEK